MQPNWMNFVDNLKYMGLGMLGIFVVIGIIILCTVLLNLFANLINKNKKKKEEK